MFLTSRQSEIVELAKSHGRVLVEELAGRFAVSPQTIRKDLNDLCDQRLLNRIHGGATFPSSTENMHYEARRQIAAQEKQAIGLAAARLIPNNASLFINIGTTTEAVGEALVDHHEMMVITNNINVANRLRLLPAMEVVIAGGVVRASDGGIVGEAAVDFIRQFKVDFAVIGTSAIDADGALLEEAARRHPGVSVRQADLAGDLAALIPEGTGLVTASALIDLVSEAWLARLAARVQEIRCALLVVLTYDGRILWEPELAGDGEIRDLVNRHQRGDKGFGPALGPEAPVTLSRLLPGVETAMSDWQIAAGEPAMRAALVTGWAGAAAEIAPDRAAAIEAWRDRASSEPRALAVGHADQLWLPD